MVCTTNISPITVMAVVDVVGVIPNTQTSAGLPVLRQTSDSFASGLSGFPVITINFRSGPDYGLSGLIPQSHVSCQS